MKRNTSKSTKGKARVDVRALKARAEDLGEQLEAARKRARQAKANFKQARKDFKKLKKTAKEARKAAKSAAAAQVQKGKRSRITRAVKPAGAFRGGPVKITPEAAPGVLPVPLPETPAAGAVLLPDAMETPSQT